MCYTPTIIDPTEDFEKVDGVSTTLEEIFSVIRNEGYRRPAHNISRTIRTMEDEIIHCEAEFFHPE